MLPSVRNRWLYALLLVPFASASQGAAQSPYDACIAHTQTNVEWNACGQQEIDRQEARLNAAWKKAYVCFDTSTPTGKDARQAFLAEQRAWVKWKDSACSFYFPRNPRDDGFGYAGREGQVLGAPTCKAVIVGDRAKWLEAFSRNCQ